MAKRFLTGSETYLMSG